MGNLDQMQFVNEMNIGNYHIVLEDFFVFFQEQFNHRDMYTSLHCLINGKRRYVTLEQFFDAPFCWDDSEHFVSFDVYDALIGCSKQNTLALTKEERELFADFILSYGAYIELKTILLVYSGLSYDNLEIIRDKINNNLSSEHIAGFSRQLSLVHSQELISDIDKRETKIINTEINKMSESEKEAFLGGIEMAFDYGLSDEIDDYNRKLYHLLMSERSVC